MIIIVFKYLTPKGFSGLSFFPFIFVAERKHAENAVFVNHEKIHIRQQLELLVVPFYVWYGLEFLVRWAQYRNRSEAYYNISFEREAYANEKDLNYLKKRSFWKFVKFL